MKTMFSVGFTYYTWNILPFYSCLLTLLTKNKYYGLYYIQYIKSIFMIYNCTFDPELTFIIKEHFSNN